MDTNKKIRVIGGIRGRKTLTAELFAQHDDRQENWHHEGREDHEAGKRKD